MLTETLRTGLSDEVIVFQTDPPAAFNVAAWFQSNNVTGDKGIGAFGDEDGWFRMLHAQTVSGMVRQRPVTAGLQHL